MPSITFRELAVPARNAGYWCDGRKIYFFICTKINDNPTYKAAIYDIKADSLKTYDVSWPTSYGAGPGCLYKVTRGGGKTYLRVLYVNVNNKLVDIEWIFNEVNDTVSAQLKRSLYDANFSTETSWQSTVLGLGLALIMNYNSPYITLVDLKDFTKVWQIDSGFDIYNPRADAIWFPRDNDIYVLVGRHLNTANFYRLKLYAKTLEEITNTNPGGDSPLPLMGDLIPLKDKTYIFASGGTVNNSSPKLIWFDEDLNKVGETPLNSIYDHARLSGHATLGLDENGYLTIAAIVPDNNVGIMSEEAACIIKIDPSDYSLVSYNKFATWTSTDRKLEGIGIGTGGKYYNLPIVDWENSEVIIVTRNHNNNNITLCKIDFSDIEITERNPRMYEVGVTKIPTQLTLQVIPL